MLRIACCGTFWDFHLFFLQECKQLNICRRTWWWERRSGPAQPPRTRSSGSVKFINLTCFISINKKLLIFYIFDLRNYWCTIDAFTLELNTYIEIFPSLLVDFAAFSNNEVDDKAKDKDLTTENHEHKRTNVAIKSHDVELVQQPFSCKQKKGGQNFFNENISIDDFLL